MRACPRRGELGGQRPPHFNGKIHSRRLLCGSALDSSRGKKLACVHILKQSAPSPGGLGWGGVPPLISTERLLRGLARPKTKPPLRGRGPFQRKDLRVGRVRIEPGEKPCTRARPKVKRGVEGPATPLRGSAPRISPPSLEILFPPSLLLNTKSSGQGPPSLFFAPFLLRGSFL